MMCSILPDSMLSAIAATFENARNDDIQMPSFHYTYHEVSDYFNDLFASLRRHHKERVHEHNDHEEDIRDEHIMSIEAEIEAKKKPKVMSVDLQAMTNALNCHCEKFELVTGKKPTTVIRRGGTLIFSIKFNKDADLENSLKVQLSFSFGPKPSVANGTQALLLVTERKTFHKGLDKWDVRFINQDADTATLEVQIPHNVPVGIWKLAVKVSPHKYDKIRDIFRLDDQIYVLFNPWNKDDQVYLEEEELRNEYVLNDVGKVWVGSYPTACGRHWVFGQFDDAVLPACVYLLENANLQPDKRGDAVEISRAISKMVNSNDDSGVLVGRWSGKYDDGKEPSQWTGSIQILEQYLTSGKPVRYGQCWVFACVVNTVCRALGIPGRVVTNLNSAHDTNMSLTIDKFVDENGEFMRYKDVADAHSLIGGGFSDSVWNFHVWNDVWMARLDLPHGFGGWQAIDATPQEKSNGIYQCGPASHVAIKTGRTELKYDVNFILGEVNADVVTWQKDEKEINKFKRIGCNTNHVGKEIITKCPGEVDDDYSGQDKELVNDSYKSAEGTDSERLALCIAASRTGTDTARLAFDYPSVSDNDVKFKIEHVERVSIGEPFSVTVTAKNKSKESRTIAMKLSAFSEFYNGMKADKIKVTEETFTLEKGEKKHLSMQVTYSEYYDRLVEYGMIRLMSLCHVKETAQSWVDEDTFQVIKPRILIKMPDNGTVGKSMVVKLSFTNPLEIALRRCSLVVDGPGLTRPKTIPIKDVESKGKMSYELPVYPKRGGRRPIIATFNSKELVDLTGSKTINVIEAHV